jgi:hypothetical protein
VIKGERLSHAHAKESSEIDQERRNKLRLADVLYEREREER